MSRSIPLVARVTIPGVILGFVAAACHEQPTPTIVRYPYEDGARAASSDDKSIVRKDEPGRKVSIDDRWILSHPQSAADLRNTEFGEREIREFWTRKGWRLTKREEQYLAETKRLYDEGIITMTSRWAVCPYTPVYQAVHPTKVMGVPIKRMQEFHFEMCENENEIQLGSPRFTRAKGYEEDHDSDGHATDPSRKPHDDH